jgi:hypothetical protein
MRRLFIIGNGFDIAHKLKTRYSDFREYLLKEYPNASPEDTLVPESITMPDGDISYNDDEVVGFLLKIISEAENEGEAWSDLEYTLGKLNYDDFFDYWNEDDNEYYTEYYNVYRNEDIASNIKGAVIMIKTYFSDWINQIELFDSKPIKIFKKLIDNNNDLFLTFNYTMTLEKLYNVKNVFHIHGQQGGKLIFGHGNPDDYFDNYIDNYTGSEYYMTELQHELKKDTSKVIQQHKEYFNTLGPLDEIYSFGFSFSKVDLVYIEEICQSSTKNTTWYLNEFDRLKFKEFKDKIIRCGFEGKFDSFSFTGISIKSIIILCKLACKKIYYLLTRKKYE